ncbi:hypothetical protein [Proteiniphilum sp. X52]|nr:hypothetical protein [Proteiniphilum sp. X52]
MLRNREKFPYFVLQTIYNLCATGHYKYNGRIYLDEQNGVPPRFGYP